MILYDEAVEETGSRIDHKVTAISCMTAAVFCAYYVCRPINTVFKTLPALAPVLVLEDSSLQSPGSQVSVLLPYT